MLLLLLRLSCIIEKSSWNAKFGSTNMGFPFDYCLEQNLNRIRTYSNWIMMKIMRYMIFWKIQRCCVLKYEEALMFISFLGCLGTSFENERSMVNLYLVDVLYKYRSDLDFDVLMHCDELTIPNQVRDWVVIQERERRQLIYDLE